MNHPSAKPAFYAIPDGEGRVVAVEPGGGPSAFASWDPRNPLAGGMDLADDTMVWSGWVEDDEASGVRTWSNEGWEAMLAWLGDALPRAREAGRTIHIRPRATHVVSDPQRCVALLEKFDDPALRLVLDPIGMLTPSMLGFVQDHLRRAFEALGAHPRLSGVVLAGAWLGTGEERVKPTSILMDRPDGGQVNARDLLSVYAEHVGVGVPVLLVGPGPDVQAARIRELLAEARAG